MKNLHKILSVVLCVVMVLSMSLTTVMAADNDIMFDLKSLGSWIYYLLEKEEIIFI